MSRDSTIRFHLKDGDENINQIPPRKNSTNLSLIQKENNHHLVEQFERKTSNVVEI